MTAALRFCPDPARPRSVDDVLAEKRREHPELGAGVTLEQLLAIAAREGIAVIAMRAGLSDRIRRVVVLYVIACTWHLDEEAAYRAAAEILGHPGPIVEAVVRCAAAERVQ